MRAQEHGYLIPRCVLGQTLTATITNAEEMGFFGGTSWSTAEAARQCIMPRVTLTRLGVLINTNSNGVDGANFIMRVSTDFAAFSNVNQTVIVDQASGFFQDTTNIDVYENGTSQTLRYNQGDNSVQVRSYFCLGEVS